MISLTRILIIAQTAEGVSVTALMQKYYLLKYAKIAAALAGIGGGALALAGLAASLMAGAPAMPVAQTAPGQFRMVRAAGPVAAIVHPQEVISKPATGAGIGGLGGGMAFSQTNYITALDPEEIKRQIDRSTRTRLRTLTSWAPR